MRKYKEIKAGLKLPANEDGRVEIPNVSRRDLPSFFQHVGYKTGVEIGVYRACFTRRFCAVGLKMYGIDPWMCYSDYYVDKVFTTRQELAYTDAIKNTKKFPKCTLIKKTSMEAVKDFEDESLDFVYIDGHHGFKYVTEDIYEWSKKIRKGGCISGHDYSYPRQKKHEGKAYILQTKWVVDAYTKAFRIKKWYVLGAEKKTFEGESRDKYRSWFWFKE